MPKFITPARLAAALGVVVGLSASATSLLDVVPKESAAGRVVVGGVGVLGTIATLIKWLDGQSKWELQQAAHAHEVAVYMPAASAVLADPERIEPAVLEDEVPIEAADEPARLQDQVSA